MYNKRIIAVVLAVALCCSVCNKERAFHGYLKSYTCMKNAFDKLVMTCDETVATSKTVSIDFIDK